MKIKALVASLALTLTACATGPAAPPRPFFDLVIRGGEIYDGSGGARGPT